MVAHSAEMLANMNHLRAILNNPFYKGFAANQLTDRRGLDLVHEAQEVEVEELDEDTQRRSHHQRVRRARRRLLICRQTQPRRARVQITAGFLRLRGNGLVSTVGHGKCDLCFLSSWFLKYNKAVTTVCCWVFWYYLGLFCVF